MGQAKTPIQVLIDDLDVELNALRHDVLIKASKLMGRTVNVQSFHGIIGGKNNRYVDAVREEFLDPDDFYSAWLRGLGSNINEDLKKAGKWAYRADSSAIRIGKLLKDPQIERYSRVFFQRNFYRNYNERVRFKPDDELWTVWFGDNAQPWGLLISPAFRFGQWTNDQSEMRRAEFEYWTVGHVLATGLVIPDSKSLMEFPDYKTFRQFYETVLKRSSNSTYEQPLADRYLNYLDTSGDVASEPLLIPEIRYEGKVVKHRYRLDFSVLNSHTREFTGFELSPASTHMNIDPIPKADLTKKAANEHVKQEWEDEMEKRNAYFERFGITTVTFTDSRLKNLDDCFQVVEAKLRARQPDKTSIDTELASIRGLV